MKTYNSKRLFLVLGLVVLAMFGVGAANATGVQNYQGRITVDAGTTSHAADWNSTAWSQVGYGSVYIQLTQDLTDTSDSVTYTMYRSIDPVACASVSNWSVAYDRVYVENPAVAAGRYVSYVVSSPVVPSQYVNYTTYPTGTNPVTTTYVYSTNSTGFTTTYGYATVAATTASVSTVLVTQTATLEGDVTQGLLFDGGGAWCLRIAGDVTTGRTVTTTIYVAPVDVYE